MNNLVQLIGELSDVHKFNDKVSSVKLKVTDTDDKTNKSYTNVFSVTAFGDVAASMAKIPQTSTVKIHGRLKNSKQEKNGLEIWTREVIVTRFKVLKESIPLPTFDTTSLEVPF